MGVRFWWAGMGFRWTFPNVLWWAFFWKTGNNMKMSDMHWRRVAKMEVALEECAKPSTQRILPDMWSDREVA